MFYLILIFASFYSFSNSQIIELPLLSSIREKTWFENIHNNTVQIQNNNHVICNTFKGNVELCKELLVIPNVIIPFGNETIFAVSSFQNKNTHNIVCHCPTFSTIQLLLVKNFATQLGENNKLSNLEMKKNLLKYNICCCKSLFVQNVIMRLNRITHYSRIYKLFDIKYTIPFIDESIIKCP